MIQFIELVPFTIQNEHYKEEYASWKENDAMFGHTPPDEYFIRHENKPINYAFPWSDYENTKQVILFGKMYSVACVGPKEYDIITGEDEFDQPITTFVQKIYIEEIKK